MSEFPAWWILGEGDDLRAALRRLQQFLFFWSVRWEEGPLPGAYFPLSWHEGSVSAGADKGGFILPSHCRPVSLSVRVDTGEITIDVNDDGSTILTTPLATSSQKGVYRARADFSTDLILGGSVIGLDIDSIDSGTPGNYGCLLVLKNLGGSPEAEVKIERSN